MKKELNVIGLDCGHCALTLEKYLEKVDGVKSCNINFSTSKLFIEVDDNSYKIVYKKIIKTAKQVNPDVKITETKESGNNIKVIDIILYLIGIVLGLVVLFVGMSAPLYWIVLMVSILCLRYKSKGMRVRLSAPLSNA
jgi:Cd2+/Zn2+-exporting ATPase